MFKDKINKVARNNWKKISLSLLLALGGAGLATQHQNAHADTTNSTPTTTAVQGQKANANQDNNTGNAQAMKDQNQLNKLNASKQSTHNLPLLMVLGGGTQQSSAPKMASASAKPQSAQPAKAASSSAPQSKVAQPVKVSSKAQSVAPQSSKASSKAQSVAPQSANTSANDTRNDVKAPQSSNASSNNNDSQELASLEADQQQQSTEAQSLTQKLNQSNKASTLWQRYNNDNAKVKSGADLFNNNNAYEQDAEQTQNKLISYYQNQMSANPSLETANLGSDGISPTTRNLVKALELNPSMPSPQAQSAYQQRLQQRWHQNLQMQAKTRNGASAFSDMEDDTLHNGTVPVTTEMARFAKSKGLNPQKFINMEAVRFEGNEAPRALKKASYNYSKKLDKAWNLYEDNALGDDSHGNRISTVKANATRKRGRKPTKRTKRATNVMRFSQTRGTKKRAKNKSIKRLNNRLNAITKKQNNHAKKAHKVNTLNNIKRGYTHAIKKTKAKKSTPRKVTPRKASTKRTSTRRATPKRTRRSRRARR